MAEYKDIMGVAATRSFLNNYIIDQEFMNKFSEFLKSFIDYSNIINIDINFYGCKSITIDIAKDNNFSSLEDKYRYDIVLSFMSAINNPTILLGSIPKAPLEVKRFIDLAKCSAPHAMLLYDINWVIKRDKNAIMIKF